MLPEFAINYAAEIQKLKHI